MLKLILILTFITYLLAQPDSLDLICGMDGWVLCDGYMPYHMKCPQGYHINPDASTFGLFCYKNSTTSKLLPGTFCGVARNIENKTVATCNGLSPLDECPEGFVSYYYGPTRVKHTIFCMLDETIDQVVPGMWCGYSIGQDSYNRGKINWNDPTEIKCHDHDPHRSCPKGYIQKIWETDKSDAFKMYAASCIIN